MSTKQVTRAQIEQAIEAHTNLNVFYGVIKVLEGGCVYGNSGNSANKTAQKIVALCHAESHRQLKLFDKAFPRVNPNRGTTP